MVSFLGVDEHRCFVEILLFDEVQESDAYMSSDLVGGAQVWDGLVGDVGDEHEGVTSGGPQIQAIVLYAGDFAIDGRVHVEGMHLARDASMGCWFGRRALESKAGLRRSKLSSTGVRARAWVFGSIWPLGSGVGITEVVVRATKLEARLARPPTWAPVLGGFARWCLWSGSRARAEALMDERFELWGSSEARAGAKRELWSSGGCSVGAKRELWSSSRRTLEASG